MEITVSPMDFTLTQDIKEKKYMHNSALFWDIIQLSLKAVAIFS